MLSSLLAWACLSLVVLYGTFRVILAARISAWSELSIKDRIFVSSCAKDLLHSVVSTPLATYAMWLMLNQPEATLDCAAPANLANLATPDTGVAACGIVCGYFLADMIILLQHPGSMVEPGLILVHHLMCMRRADGTNARCDSLRTPFA